MVQTVRGYLRKIEDALAEGYILEPADDARALRIGLTATKVVEGEEHFEMFDIGLNHIREHYEGKLLQEEGVPVKNGWFVEELPMDDFFRKRALRGKKIGILFGLDIAEARKRGEERYAASQQAP